MARLTEAAGGNPLFLEELCEMLVDTGEAAPIDARRVPRPEGRPVALPVTLDALITSRLDLLPAAERLAIEIAAVEGTVFTREAVLALAPASVRGEVTPAIDGLVRRDLARPTTVEGAPALRFRHVLVRDAAYRGIAKVRRADAHERFARWLERASPERPEADETIGYHLEQACRYRSELGGAGAELRALGADAATRLERAARRARTRGDGPAAVRLLRRATAVLPDADVQRGRLLVELGATLVDDGRLGDAQAALDAAGGVAGAARDPALDARLAVERLVTDFQVDTAAVVARTAAATGALAAAFTRAADDEGLCRLAHLEAMVNWVEGQVAAAETSWARSADIARRLGNAVRLADVLSWIPSAALYGPMPVAEAIPRCEQVSAELQGSRRAEAEVLGPLAALFAMQGAFERARSLIARRAAVIAEVGFAMHSVGEWAAQVELLAGDPRAAEVHLRAGFERLDEIGERGFLATTAALLARALQDQGRDDEAFAFTEVCEQTASRDDLAAQIAWRGIRARILATRRQTAEAVALASEAVALAERTDLLSDHGDALLDLTQCLRAAGRSGDATETARAARALYHRKGNMVASDRAQAVLHELVPV